MSEQGLRAALEKYFSNGGPDTPIRTTWHESVEHWEAPAEDIRELIEGSAVPEPVDRLAIERVLRERMRNSNFMQIHEPVRTQAIDTWVQVFADAVLAVLAGEQEQARPE